MQRKEFDGVSKEGLELEETEEGAAAQFNDLCTTVKDLNDKVKKVISNRITDSPCVLVTRRIWSVS
jgi:HSP90 family molecular chaperone